MPTLATNQRTATKAAIKRGSTKARAAMHRLDKTSRAEITALYKSTVGELQQIIFRHADATGHVPQHNLKSLTDTIEQRLDQLTRESELLVNRQLQSAANLGVDPFIGVDDLAISTQAAAQAAVQFTRTFTHNDGLNLSGRLWKLNSGANEIASRAVRSAVIQGQSASAAAQAFLNQAQAVPAAVQKQIDNANGIKVARVFGEQLMRREKNPYGQALQVMRTEINRAHGEAYMVSAINHPDFGGFRYMLSPAHPRPDICDMHSSVNLFGRGPGVYPTRERCPWPAHPNILSFVVMVFNDEITDADRKGKTTRIDWLKEQSFDMQSGVLGGRRKAVALREGILKEREITTPWKVLKKKYENNGVDLTRLEPPPIVKGPIPLLRGENKAALAEYINEARNQADPRALNVIDNIAPLKFIKGSRYDDVSYYSPSNKYISITENRIKSGRRNTFWHEYGHHVDFYGSGNIRKPNQISYTPKSSGGLMDSIQETRDSYLQKSQKNAARLKAIDADLVTMNDPYIDDLFGSLTFNKIGGGHTKSYLKKNKGANANTEVFANLFEVYSRQERTGWHYLESKIPALTHDFELLINRVAQ
jgi:hypothetical protein